jgi:hypothetical protein
LAKLLLRGTRGNTTLGFRRWALRVEVEASLRTKNRKPLRGRGWNLGDE